jgi:hypothetical protein
MKAFWNILRHKYFHFAATIMIVFLPLVLFLNTKQQDLRGRAEASTTLYFTPASSKSFPIHKKVGDDFYVDLMLNPGKNQVSIIKIDISYDPTKLSISPGNSVEVNEAMFPQILEGPVYSPGRIQVVLSVGLDVSKAITTEGKALTLNFVAKNTSNSTAISIGSNSQVFSVAAADNTSDNVLSTSTPAYIKISKNTGKPGGGKGKPSR